MDAQLHVVRARDGVEAGVGETTASFEDFFREQYAGLYRALCLMTGSRLEAEEVLQEAFMKVFERWDRVVLMENPTGYLFRVAINEFRSRYRRAARAARRAITFSRLDDAFAAVEDRDVVVRALKQLIPQQRAAIVLTSLLGYSSQEAGQILGIRPATVRVLGTRARAAMRQTVGETR